MKLKVRTFIAVDIWIDTDNIVDIDLIRAGDYPAIADQEADDLLDVLLEGYEWEPFKVSHVFNEDGKRLKL